MRLVGTLKKHLPQKTIFLYTLMIASVLLLILSLLSATFTKFSNFKHSDLDSNVSCNALIDQSNCYISGQ